MKTRTPLKERKISFYEWLILSQENNQCVFYKCQYFETEYVFSSNEEKTTFKTF